MTYKILVEKVHAFLSTEELTPECRAARKELRAARYEAFGKDGYCSILYRLYTTDRAKALIERAIAVHEKLGCDVEIATPYGNIESEKELEDGIIIGYIENVCYPGDEMAERLKNEGFTWRKWVGWRGAYCLDV